jgi:hypothetical protein
MLCTEVLRAPEPVRVPAPKVTGRCQVVDIDGPQRLIVDLLSRVVADRRSVVHEATDAHDLLVDAEHDGVDEIRRRAALRRESVHECVRIAIPRVLGTHEAPHRQQPRTQAQCIPQSPVGVREAEEQVPMLVVGPAGHDFTVRQQHLDLRKRVVHEAVEKGRGLDAHPCRGASDRDRLQLRNDGGHQPLVERCRHEVLIGGQALDVDQHARAVDAEHMVEPGQVEWLPSSAVPVPEQVRRALRERQWWAACAALQGRSRGFASYDMAVRHTGTHGSSDSWRE